MSESDHSQEWMIPFFELMSWLEARARVSASTRPALEADDLQNEVISRYLAEAEDWFEGETTTTSRQRGRNFMKFLLWQEVTKYDRQVAREKRGASRAQAHDHFHAGRKPVLRPLDAAWNAFVHHRQTERWDEQLSHRRRTYGEILRSAEPMGSLTEQQIKTCYDWLNRTVLRARAQLCARLEAVHEEVA